MTVASFSAPVHLWPDGKFRTAPVTGPFVVSGSNFGAPPTVTILADWSQGVVGQTAQLNSPIIGSFDSGSYATGLLPKYFAIGGQSGIGLREGGNSAATDNRLTGFKKTLDSYTDRCIIYHLGVPEGRYFPGSIAIGQPSIHSSLKNHWEFYGEPDSPTEADLVCVSWNGDNWVVGGNQAVTEAGGTPNSLYCGDAFDFYAWNRHCTVQKAGTPDPFTDAGYSEVHITTSLGTSRNLRTSLPTFNSANSAHPAYTTIAFPGWAGSGFQDEAQMLYRGYYFATGENCQARVEMINAATYAAATDISLPLPFTSWTDTQIVVSPPAHWWEGMTHICVTNANGTQQIQAINP